MRDNFENVDDYSAPEIPARSESKKSPNVQSGFHVDGNGVMRCRATGKTLTELCLEVTGGKDQIKRT